MNFYPIEIKFRNASGDWGLNAELLIRIVSPCHIHVEAKFPDGRSFSSTSAKEGINGRTGVRWKNINYSHSERWTNYTLWVTKAELDKILFKCECLVTLGLLYDFRGAAGCAITGAQDPWKYFCSEVVYDAVCTMWLPERLNHKMYPDKLEEVIMILEVRLLERKFKVEGI
jgi:hypothetical protein